MFSFVCDWSYPCFLRLCVYLCLSLCLCLYLHSVLHKSHLSDSLPLVSVIYVKLCGYHNQLFQKSTQWHTTDVVVSYTERFHDCHPLIDSLFVSTMKNDSVQSGLNWIKNSQRSSITVCNKRYGIQQETRRCNAR